MNWSTPSSAATSQSATPEPEESESIRRAPPPLLVGRLSLKGAERSPGMETGRGSTSARRSSRKLWVPSSSVEKEPEPEPEKSKEPKSPRIGIFARSASSSSKTDEGKPTRSPLQKARLWSRRRKRAPDTDDAASSLSERDPSSIKAAEVLAKLQSRDLNSIDSLKWTTEDEEIVADNINLLNKSIEDTPPAASIHSSSSSTRRKRSLSEAKESDHSDAEDSDDVTSRVGSKRAKTSTNKKFIRPRIPLEELNPQPIQIDYKSHPSQDRDDKWYVEMFRQLFHMCETFASTYFEIHDLEAGEFFEPWGLDLSPEFISWAELVAEEDEFLDGWDGVLRNSEQRKWLVMAILVRVLRIKIFDDDLWGGNEEEREMLRGIDRALLNREGFQRTLLRSQTVNSILGRNPTTENFYPDIARLTAQITLLLKPLSDYLTSIPPVTPKPHPNPQDQYQSLHNIVSNAAYLSLCIRLSPTIFHFVDVSLGDAFDRDDHWSLSPVLSNKSTTAVYDSFSRAWQDRGHRVDELRSELNRLLSANRQDSRAYQRVNEEYQTLLNDPRPDPWHFHKPMTKIAVWPVITRYKPGGEQDDINEANGARVPLREKDGFRIYQISKAAVVTYFGRKDRKGKISLQDFVDAKRKAMGVRERGLWQVGVLATTMAVVGLVGVEFLRERVGPRLSDGFSALSGLVRAR